MGIVSDLYSLKFEVKILEARNVELKSSSPTTLFVRFYLHAGRKSKIELNTEEIYSRSDNVMIWNQSFGLECRGNETAVEELKQESVVFEVRRRKTTSFLRKLSRSELVGRGEISWKSVIESDGMETERFVVMGETKDRILEDWDKFLLLKIALKVQASKTVNTKRVEDLCQCRDCRRCNCLDYEAFVVACALDGI